MKYIFTLTVVICTAIKLFIFQFCDTAKQKPSYKNANTNVCQWTLFTVESLQIWDLCKSSVTQILHGERLIALCQTQSWMLASLPFVQVTFYGYSHVPSIYLQNGDTHCVVTRDQYPHTHTHVWQTQKQNYYHNYYYYYFILQLLHKISFLQILAQKYSS